LFRGSRRAHDRGIIHRDLSPDNIILPEGDVDRAKLIDFGIAKSANPGDATVVGSSFAGKVLLRLARAGRSVRRPGRCALGYLQPRARPRGGRDRLRQALEMGASPPPSSRPASGFPISPRCPPGLRPVLEPMLQAAAGRPARLDAANCWWL